MRKNFTNKNKLTVGIASVILGMFAVLGTSTVSYADNPTNGGTSVPAEKNAAVKDKPRLDIEANKLDIKVDENADSVSIKIGGEKPLLITKSKNGWSLSSGVGYEVSKSSDDKSFSIQKTENEKLPCVEFEVVAKNSKNTNDQGQTAIIIKEKLRQKIAVVDKGDVRIIEKDAIKTEVAKEDNLVEKDKVNVGDNGKVQYTDSNGNTVVIFPEDVIVELAKPLIYSDVDSSIIGLKHTDEKIIIKLDGKVQAEDMLEVKIGDKQYLATIKSTEGNIQNSDKITYTPKTKDKEAYYEITGVNLKVGEKVVAKLIRNTVSNETEIVVSIDVNEINEDLKSAEAMIPGLIYNNTSIADRFNEKYFFNVDFGTSLYKLFTGEEDKELGIFKGFNMIAGLQAGYTFRPINNLNLTVFGEYDKPRYHQVMFGIGTKYLDFSGFGRYRLTITDKNKNNSRKLLHSIDLYGRYSHEFNAGSHIYLTPAIGAYGSVTMPTKLTENAKLKPMINLSVDGSLKVGYMMDMLTMYVKPSFKFGYIVANLEHAKIKYIKSEDEYNKMLSYGLEFGTEKLFKDHIKFGLSTTFSGKLNQLKNSDDKSYGRANIKLSSHVGYQW